MIPDDIDARITATQAAYAVHVSKQLINSWRARGKLIRGQDGLYRYGDVLAVERQMRRSGYSHRRAVAA